MEASVLSKVSSTKWAMSENLLLALSLVFLILLAQFHWKRRKLYKVAAQLQGPATLPIIGNGWDFMGDNYENLNSVMDWCKIYKSPFRVWMGHKLFFAIYEPKHLEIIMNSPYALQKADLYKYTQPLVGMGLFSAPVPKWRRNRRIIMPTFNQKILDSFVEVFSEQSMILEQQLEKEAGNGTFDVFQYFSRFTLDSICETAMGVKVDAQTTNSDFVQSANKGMEIMYKRMFTVWYHIDWIFKSTRMSTDLDYHSGKVRDFTSRVVKQKKNEYYEQVKESNETPEALVDEMPRKRDTFLAQLIKLSEEGAHLTDEDLRDEVNTVMIGGSETTASVNSFTLILLGMHPAIQDKVYQEVIDAVGKDRPIEVKDLHNLPYTEMVIKESMRIFPVGPILVRAITKDIQLDECVIPKDTSVAFCILETHRHPKIYPKPFEFDPLRFLPEEVAKRHPYSFLPFSGGPRNCVGVKYAYMAMKTVIATLVRKYRITSHYKSIEDIKLKADLVLKPVDGYPISLELRE